MMLPLWTFTVLLGAVAGREVCYDRLGCFTDDSPYGGTLERPLKVLPWSPNLVNTRFLLYTNENPNSYQVITADASKIRSSNFKTNRKTHFVVHGFTDKGEDNWLSDICKNILQVENANCICVDWKGGSRTGYTQATQNVQIVGAEIAYLVKALQSDFGYSPSNVHIIGHSLGSHVAGEAGKRLNGAIGRITGLDPAEPYFQNTPEVVRLDPSDAQFVDAIHTDAAPMIPNMGLGMSQTVGHLDFFPNGGKEMPGCQKNALSQIVDMDGIWEGSRDFVACNHLRSYKYYTDSIVNPTGFAGFSCASYNDFTSGYTLIRSDQGLPRIQLKDAMSCVHDRGNANEMIYFNDPQAEVVVNDYPGNAGYHEKMVLIRIHSISTDKCFPCPSGGCPQMGHYADRYSGRTSGVGQTFYLNTGDASNFARWRYQVTVTLSGQRVTGHILVSLFGNGGNSKQYEIFKGSLQSGKTLTSEIDSAVDVGDVQKVKFIWYNNVINPTLPKVGASRIMVERNDGRVFNFCSSKTVREDVLLTLEAC